eukprot:14104158-Alexandrium_andersonii.AAC.1
MLLGVRPLDRIRHVGEVVRGIELRVAKDVDCILECRVFPHGLQEHGISGWLFRLGATCLSNSLLQDLGRVLGE